MDIATIIGLVGGTVAIGLGVVTSGGSIGGIIDIPSVFVTVGGSYMALFIVAPLIGGALSAIVWCALTPKEEK